MGQIIIYNSDLAELVTASLEATGLTRTQLGKKLAPIFGCKESTAENYVGQVAMGRVRQGYVYYNRLSLFLTYLGVPAVHPLITQIRDQFPDFNYPPRENTNLRAATKSATRPIGYGSFTKGVIDKTIQDILRGT